MWREREKGKRPFRLEGRQTRKKKKKKRKIKDEKNEGYLRSNRHTQVLRICEIIDFFICLACVKKHAIGYNEKSFNLMKKFLQLLNKLIL